MDSYHNSIRCYCKLGDLISSGEIENIEFTYIGRWPEKFKNKGINVMRPLNEKSLSMILPDYDIYLTASIEEAGANHVLEGMACGLPILYRKSGGSIEEYCKNYGLIYNGIDDLINCINCIIDNYSYYKEKVCSYNCKIDDTIKRYIDTIKKILK